MKTRDFFIALAIIVALVIVESGLQGMIDAGLIAKP